MDEKEFLKKKNEFYEELLEIQNKYSEWLNDNLPTYKGGGKVPLANLIMVSADNENITVHVGVKDMPNQILSEIYSLQIKVFNQ